MKRILSAKLKVDCFGCKKGDPFLPTGDGWTIYETQDSYQWLSTADLLALSDHGIVELEFEKEEPKFKVGDWVMRKDGNSFTARNVYRGKVDWDDGTITRVNAWTIHSHLLTLAPPEPTTEQIEGYKIADFRPPKKGERYYNYELSGPATRLDTDFCSPRYILEPIVKPCTKPFSRCLDCDEHNQCERYGKHREEVGTFQDKGFTVPFTDMSAEDCEKTADRLKEIVKEQTGQMSCEDCGDPCCKLRGQPIKDCPDMRMRCWTPRKQEGEKPEGMPTAKIEDFPIWTFKKIHELQRRLDAIEQTARTNPYHPFDIVGAVKELQEKVEAMEKTGG